LLFNRCVENREACFQKERGRCGERDSGECAYARSNSVDSELHCGRSDFKTCYDFMYRLFQFKLFRESFFCSTSMIACIFLKRCLNAGHVRFTDHFQQQTNPVPEKPMRQSEMSRA